MGNGIGLASFIIAIINCILSFLVFPPLIWNAMGTTSLTSRAVIVAATIGLIVLFLAFIGIILGIIGGLKDEIKTFGMIGLILSIICLAFILGAMAIGVSVVW
ncbi:MAG: hypothetical protein ACFFD2_25135 [Promethearchaeota archaeon]